MKTTIPFITTIIFLGVVQGIFLGIILITLKRGNRIANRVMGILVILFSLSISHILLLRSGLYLKAPHLIMTNHPLLFLFGPLFLLYVSIIIKKRFTFKPAYLLHLIPFVVYVIYLMPFYLKSGAYKIWYIEHWQTTGKLIDYVVGPLQIIHLFTYIFIINKIQRKHSENLKATFSTIEKINLSWIRTVSYMLASIFAVMASFYLLVFLGYQQLVISYGGDLIALLVAISMYTAGYFAIKQPEIFSSIEEFPPFKKYESSPLTPDRVEKYLQKLLEVMETDKPYLSGDLTIQTLAQRLGIPSYQVSQIINDRLKQNFFDFVNGYRVEEAKKRLRDPNYQHYSILSIAFDVGFNSKSAFNAAFKKHTQSTPSAFRQI